MVSVKCDIHVCQALFCLNVIAINLTPGLSDTKGPVLRCLHLLLWFMYAQQLKVQ